MNLQLPKSVLSTLITAGQSSKRLLSILLDPDKTQLTKLTAQIKLYQTLGVSFILIGGSMVGNYVLDEIIKIIKDCCSIPVVLFPGSILQITPNADAILFLSLISGRNPDLLIGQQVLAAPLLEKSQLEIIPTGYLLIDGGKPTSAHYMSQTCPIPYDKPEIAAYTALAGAYLGHQVIYLDTGSGALNPVHPETINAVKQKTQLPLIVGGGIKTSEQANDAFNAGATMIVIGTIAEQSINKELFSIFDIIH